MGNSPDASYIFFLIGVYQITFFILVHPVWWLCLWLCGLHVLCSSDAMVACVVFVRCDGRVSCVCLVQCSHLQPAVVSFISVVGGVVHLISG